jgi:hypothetical protein
MGISVTASVLIMEYRGRPLQAPHLLRRGHLHPGAPHPRLAQPAAAEQCLAPHAVPPQPLLAPTTPAAQHGSLQPPAASTPARPLARVSPAHARSQRRSEGGCCSAWLAGGTCGDVGAAHAPQTPARAAAAAARRPAARSSWIYSVTRTGVTWVNKYISVKIDRAQHGNARLACTRSSRSRARLPMRSSGEKASSSCCCCWRGGERWATAAELRARARVIETPWGSKSLSAAGGMPARRLNTTACACASPLIALGTPASPALLLRRGRAAVIPPPAECRLPSARPARDQPQYTLVGRGAGC